VTAAQIGAVAAINGITAPGGHFFFWQQGEDLETANDPEAGTILLVNNHNGRKDNPHEVRHDQVDPLPVEYGPDETRDKHLSNSDYTVLVDHLYSPVAHGSTPENMEGRIVRRDAEGRAKVSDPEDDDDIATKGYVDSKANTVQGNLDYHHGMTNVHGATSTPEAERLIIRDGAGRAQVEDPQGEKDIVNKRSMDAALEGFFKMDGGTNTFVGNGGERSFTHNLGGVPRTVQITPMAPDSSGTGGTVGEIWYRANETTIWVGNTGSATISFGWFAML
jgi:hypothetical protein